MQAKVLFAAESIERWQCKNFQDALRLAGFNVTTLDDGRLPTEMAKDYDIVVLVGSGTAWIEEITKARTSGVNVPVLYVTVVHELDAKPQNVTTIRYEAVYTTLSVLSQKVTEVLSGK